jgi:hypothetical protein
MHAVHFLTRTAEAALPKNAYGKVLKRELRDRFS